MIDVKNIIKKRWPIILIGLVLLGGGYTVAKLTRGIRNNNAGNIRHSSSKWQGQAPNQTDSDFVQFISAYWGIRALAKTLKTYQQKYGYTTIPQIISRWAPNNENDTKSYIASVASRSGFTVNDTLDFNNPSVLAAITNAIIHHENGYNPYKAEEILAAVRGA